MLNDRLKELSPQYENNGNYLFYLATPPLLYELIPKYLHDAGLLKKPGLKRIIVEKPFGYDLASAQKLNKIYAAYFKEEDIYRIDHFLGKETVQNIMVTRFGSTIYEPIWNRNYIDHVEITAVENMGIGTRGGYYDGAGALRDMVQNHLMQLLAITAMEPPAKFDKNGFRNEVIKVYQSLRPLTDEYIRDNVVRGQYIAGDDRIGYREEKNVHPDSRTDTYVAMCLYVDNWRWQGVPFYIRTGKQMPTKVTEIVIHFKPTYADVSNEGGLVQRRGTDYPYSARRGNSSAHSHERTWCLGFYMGTMEMDFSYDQHDQETGDAYVRLLEDSLAGDPTLFTRSDAVDESWTYFDKILDYWKKHPETPLYGYPAGTWGPKEADVLINRSHAEWTNPCKNLTHSNLYCKL
ncbi:glucose-6-phosphate dehydrogenase [Phocaeicola dorei]|nr:glucose-6-phosphate dehydrogenase [Phocaeicola dorei]